MEPTKVYKHRNNEKNSDYYYLSQYDDEYDYYLSQYDDDDDDDDDYDDKCIRKTYIHCPLCESRTSYGVQIDVNENGINYFCFNCNGLLTVCGNCFDIENGKCHMLRIISKYLTDYYDHIDTYKEIEKTHKNLKIMNKDTGPEIIWDDNSYIYPNYLDEVENFMGHDGGIGPKYYCDFCKKGIQLSDK